ncbi:MAG: hypothetical protein ICV62_03120 [Cyanobacteria bacterium Co-bin13]|nr:hypothetical protein [Cyanobacteria bacterium Co-bin13]
MTRLDQETILRKLQGMLRNLGLLQRYGSSDEQEFLESIEQVLVHQAIQFALTEYPLYIEAIQAYLTQA